MSFDALLAKVQQAERALDVDARRTTASFRQLKSSWREAWTPGRILIAGVVSGFLVGRARPLRLAGNAGAMQLLSMLAGLFAGESNHAVAGEADDAAAATGMPASAGAGQDRDAA